MTTYGPLDRTATIGVVPFTVAGAHHGLVAAVLGFEHGIAVRSGCFCAHPYVAHLLGLDGPAARHVAERVRHGHRQDLPGLVRVSLGFYNDAHDVDRLLDAIDRIVRADIAGRYRPDDLGEFRPIVPSTTPAELDSVAAS